MKKLLILNILVALSAILICLFIVKIKPEKELTIQIDSSLYYRAKFDSVISEMNNRTDNVIRLSEVRDSLINSKFKHEKIFISNSISSQRASIIARLDAEEFTYGNKD